MTEKAAFKDIFFDALELEAGESRDRFLEKACDGDSDLRHRVEALLAAHAEPESYLERPAAEFQLEATEDLPSEREPPGSDTIEQPGTMIGPYKLMEKVGEGGMGAVYVAEQRKPVRRKVALKIIKPGMDTREVIARFEAERQALAMMDHPNIARVLDAGATDSGRPYFVMELVRGITITEYCDQNSLTTRERLDLFVTVCHAIKHAHQKGVIHRDIKPSNVMVTLHDGEPVPKIIDFGVAKAINQQLTERTIYTQYAQMVGTPLYMSPEQAEMSGLDIDTRTDIYSLGVLLYELLTGTTPFEKSRIHEAAYDEVRRIIREEEPPKPSTRISTLGKTDTSISAHRKSDPKRLSQLVRGDLDWIVMKTLEKDRTRRYETANDLAADIVRHLNHEPIIASPPSTIYKLRKFVRRNRATMATVGLVAIALVLGSIVATWQAIRATQAEIQALDAGARATAAHKTAVTSFEEAERQARQAKIAATDATDARKEMYRYLYVAHMNLAHQALETQNNVPRTLDLLNRHLPHEGAEDLRGFEWYYLRQLCREALATPALRDKTNIRSVAYSPDGKSIATGGHDGLVKLWDLATHTISRTFQHTMRVECVAFSPNGRILASGSTDGSIILWDLATGENIRTVNHTATAWTVVFSPDGKLLASSGFNKNIRVWEVDTGQLRQTLKGHKSTVHTIAFSPDSKMLASGSVDRTAKIWNLLTDDPPRTFKGHSSYIRSIAFSPDGKTFATGSMDATIRLWTVATGEQETMLVGHALEVTSLAFRGDRTLASGSADNTVRSWDLETGRARVFKGHGVAIWSIALSSDGRTLASASYDQTVKLWDLDAAADRNTIPAYTDTGNVLAFASDGKSLTIAAIGKDVTMYDVATCTKIDRLAHRAQFVQLSHDGKVALTSNQPGLIRPSVAKLWELPKRKELGSLEALFPMLSADGKTVVLGSLGGKIRFWDVEKGEERTVIEKAHAGPCGGALLSDGTTLMTVSPLDKTLKFWDARTGELRATEEMRGAFWGGAAESLDGTTVAMGIGQVVRIWDVASGEELAPFEGHAGDVLSVAFSSDGNRLATGSQDGTAKLWDVETREQLLTLNASPGRVKCVAISPDGKTLAAASEGDNLVKIWRAPTDDADEPQ